MQKVQPQKNDDVSNFIEAAQASKFPRKQP